MNIKELAATPSLVLQQYEVDMQAGLNQMLGRVFLRVEGGVGDEHLLLVRDDGVHFLFHHFRDCCECVEIEDIIGDLHDLIGTPLLVADMETNEYASGDPYGFNPYKYECDEEDGTYTWTFYKFATIKGYVDLRWLGESNGYYGERVHLCMIPE
jgi:hypothetical protein